MAASNTTKENQRQDKTPSLHHQPERPTRFTTATERHERSGEAGERIPDGYMRSGVQEERARTHLPPAVSSPTSPPTTSHVFPSSGKPISPVTAGGVKTGSSSVSQGSGGLSANNGYGYEDPSINVSRHVNVNASANPQAQEIMGWNGIYGYASGGGAGGAGGVEERARSVSATAKGSSSSGEQPAASANANDPRTGGTRGVSAAFGTGAGAGNAPTLVSSSSVPTTTSSAAPRASTSVHTRRVDEQPARRPSLASPLPPTPLVPSSSPQRFPSSVSDASSSPSPAFTPPRAPLGSNASSTTPSPAQNPAAQARNVSRSLTSTSSSTPPFASSSYNTHTTQNVSHPSLSRPLTAPSSPLSTALSVRPDSPSTAMMMKRLLSKPAPVGHGYNTQSGSESESFSGLAGIGAGGYTRRTKEALALQQQKAKNGRRVPDNLGGGSSFMDIDFNVNLDALDDRIATLGDWNFSSSPLPPGAVRIGTGMDAPQHRAEFKRRPAEGTPGSSPGHSNPIYRLANGSGSASGHGHDGSSSSSPVQSSVWVEAREKDAEKGKEKEKKEKRKPNVLRRKASTTASLSSPSSPPTSLPSVLPSIAAQSRLPPQPSFSPITLSPGPPQHSSNPQHEEHSSSSYSPPNTIHNSSFSSANINHYPSPALPNTHLSKIRPLPKPPSPTKATSHYESNLQNTQSGPDDDSARTGYLRPGPGQIESNEMLRLLDHQQVEEVQSMDGRGLWQAQHQQKPLPEYHLHQQHGESQNVLGGKQGQSGGTYHHQHQQQGVSSFPQEESESSFSSNVASVSRSRSMMPANTKSPPNPSTSTTNPQAILTATSSNKKIGSKNTSIHRSASASAALSSNSGSSSRSTKQAELQEEAFREYQREYQLEYLRFRAESANIKTNTATKTTTVPDSANGNTLHPPSFSYARAHSPTRSTSPSPSPSRSAFGGLSRSFSLAGSSVGSSRGDRSLSRDSNREHQERRMGNRLGDSPLPSPMSASTRLGSDVEGSPSVGMEKPKPKSPLFFGVRGFGRDGAKGRGVEAEKEREKVKRGKDKDKERGRTKVPSTTPAASFIEAYKRQEKERDELARMARGDDSQAGFEGKAHGQQDVAEVERVEMNRRYRATETDARTTELEQKQKHATGFVNDKGRFLTTIAGDSSTSLVPSRRHSVSLSSSLSLSAMVTSTTSPPRKPASSSTTASHSANTPTPAPVTIRRNMTVDGSTVLQRKSGFSFASGWTTDSGIDLDVGRRWGEVEGGGGKGFDVIERYMNGGGTAGHVSSTSASTTATTKTKDYLGVSIEDPVNLTIPTAITATTAATTKNPIKYRSSSTPATAPDARPNSADVAPYYTVFGSSSGRTVAVGSREDAWAAYEQGRVSTGDRGKEKERAGLGRTLSKKVSGRWKRQTGGTTVFEHGRASMQHDNVAKKAQDGKGRSLRLSIEKMADECGVVKAVNGSVWDEPNAPARPPLQTTPGGGNSLGSGGGGGRFWKLMKRISIGGGLRDRYQEQSSTQCLPPIPPLPEPSVNRVLHGSRSIDSSLKNGRLGKSSSTSASSSPGLPSSSRPSMSSSLTAPTKNPSLPPPPIPSPSSIPANSSTSSLPVGTPPLTTTMTERLQQHIISPGQLRKVQDQDISPPSLNELQASHQAISVNIPSHDPAPTEDWAIVRSPSVELSSLTLPPRRFMVPPASSATLSMTAAANSVVGVGIDEQGGEGDNGRFSSPPQRREMIDDDEDEDGDQDDEDERANRSESPTIPSFSTSDAINSFPSRRASASLSQRSRNSPAVSPVGGIGQSPLSSVSPTTLVSLPPPPPRPTRSAQRPTPGSTPLQTQPTLLPPKSFTNIPSDTLPESTNILSGRKSESHLPSTSSTSPPKNSMHHRRSSGGLSTITIKAFSSQRRSSSFGVGVGYPTSGTTKDGPGSPVFGTFGRNSAHRDTAVTPLKGKKEGKGETKETKFALTEQEKAAKWADLLERSERAGGTLRVDLGVGV